MIQGGLKNSEARSAGGQSGPTLALRACDVVAEVGDEGIEPSTQPCKGCVIAVSPIAQAPEIPNYVSSNAAHCPRPLNNSATEIGSASSGRWRTAPFSTSFLSSNSNSRIASTKACHESTPHM